MKSSLMPYAAKALSSDALKYARRQIFKLKRKLSGQRPQLDIFLRVNDPYSYLLVQVLDDFSQRFQVGLNYYVVNNVDENMFPQLERWHQHALKDAHALAGLYQLTMPLRTTLPKKEAIEACANHLVLQQKHAKFLQQANTLLAALWSDQALSLKPTNKPLFAKETLTANAQKLAQKGHYLGAMIYFEGEWYWGLDRLDHLESRLISMGLAKKEGEAPQFNLTYKNFCRRSIAEHHQRNKGKLTLYWSARSPYSYIGLERAVQLAEHYTVPLEIKPVLPMVMRGLPVPQNKKMYIFHDTKREAQKLGLPYGFVADPLGPAVERCYALVDYARQEQKLPAFLLSFARAVNTEGIHAENARGMCLIVERAGLSWLEARSLLEQQDETWRSWTETNLEEMLKLGYWGVPCLRYSHGDNQVSCWGQDRLWLIEEAINGSGADL